MEHGKTFNAWLKCRTEETKRNTIKCENSTLSNGNTTSQILVLAKGWDDSGWGVREARGRGIVSTPTCIYVCMYIPSHRGTESTKTYGKRQPKPRKLGKKCTRRTKQTIWPKNLAKAIAIARWVWDWVRFLGMEKEMWGLGLSGAWHHNKVVDNGKHVNQKLWHKDKRK